MKGIHLFVPMLHRRDAVGEHTRALRQRLVAAGIPSRIYTELPDTSTVAETRPYLEYAADAEPGDVLVYQFATGSVMATWMADRPEPVVVNYHGITPPQYFAPWNNAIARLQVDAQQRLAQLAPRSALGIADSRFISEELRSAGCPDIRVVPVAGISIPTEEQTAASARRRSEERDRHGNRWLSVGRWAPNKAHHETIAALFVARATSDPGAQLTLVGSPTEPAYAGALRRFAATLGLADAVEFASGISDDELAARYDSADVLVLLSDHEGFGVPLVEAMGHGLPIVAFGAGAVPEVLGEAGVLLSQKSPGHVAAAVGALLTDPGEQRRLARLGRSRLVALQLEDAEDLLVDALMSVFEPPAAGR